MDHIGTIRVLQEVCHIFPLTIMNYHAKVRVKAGNEAALRLIAAGHSNVNDKAPCFSMESVFFEL